MGLKQAANYFARTPILGWNGSRFVPTRAKGAFDPYDRFVSEREFGLKRRMLLVSPENPIPDNYSVIRLGPTGPICLKGWMNEDIDGLETYSLIYLVLISRETGQLIQLTKAAKASGMAFGTTDTILGTWHCSTERVTYTNSPEFHELRVTDSTITLPSNCPINADHEFAANGKRYVVQEAYKTAGFVQVRAQVKNP